MQKPDLADRVWDTVIGGDCGFDPLLCLVGELGAVTAEELDPVVVPGVVGRGDDRSEVEP